MVNIRRRPKLGEAFGWLWAAYAVSAYGTGIGFGAFSVVAITVSGAGSAEVAALSSAGLAMGALLAIPLGPWLEFRAKRPVMIATDAVRFAALASIPLAYWLGALSFAQLLLVATVTAAAKIAFTVASGAYLRTIVPADGLLVATSRFESTTWSATVVGPPVGGAAIGLLGPVTTIVIDATSYLLSALGIAAIRQPEQPPTPRTTSTRRWSDIAEGWRYILAHRTLRRLFFNTVLVNGLIMATEPLLSVMMLSHLRFPVWQYGLAFAVACVGGLIGSRLARHVAAHYGEPTVLRMFGTLRACWPLGLVFIQPGVAGLVIVMATEFGLILCASVFNPVFAAYRLNNIDADRHARVLTAWSITTGTSTAVLTMSWGLLAQVAGPRAAIGLAGILLLGTPFLLPRKLTTPEPASRADLAPSPPARTDAVGHRDSGPLSLPVERLPNKTR
ncbi:MFS transporter [Nocardia xishanensis]|uniref:MFS transporter n=1 Tax=Nocardia xishanensis TaxID=238964 RepID=UPI000AC69EF2|nr:MFS transporter [Nocardia xishanensis]